MGPAVRVTWDAAAVRGLVVLAVLTAAELAGGSRTSAQVVSARPIAPATGVEAMLDARYQSVSGIGDAGLHAAEGGLSLAGHWAWHLVELGVGWGVRMGGVSLQGIGARARVGLPPLRIWAGTGFSHDAWAFGIRLIGGASLALIGAEAAASNGERALVDLEGRTSARFGAVLVELGVGVGVAYAGEYAYSGIGHAQVGAELGERAWALRPFIGVGAAAATDIGFGGELLLGARFGLDPSEWRVTLGLRPWRDPSGEIVRLTASVHFGLPDSGSDDDERRARVPSVPAPCAAIEAVVVGQIALDEPTFLTALGVAPITALVTAGGVRFAGLDASTRAPRGSRQEGDCCHTSDPREEPAGGSLHEVGSRHAVRDGAQARSGQPNLISNESDRDVSPTPEPTHRSTADRSDRRGHKGGRPQPTGRARAVRSRGASRRSSPAGPRSRAGSGRRHSRPPPE